MILVKEPSSPFMSSSPLKVYPQHAWTQEIAEKVLCDEAVIHHIEESSRRRLDQRAYHCWAFSKDSSRIPQLVYLSLIKLEPE
jgi:hypothetical protein